MVTCNCFVLKEAVTDDLGILDILISHFTVAVALQKPQSLDLESVLNLVIVVEIHRVLHLV